MLCRNVDVSEVSFQPATCEYRCSPGSVVDQIDRLSAGIVEALKTIYDPEIPVNIYELGLIYRVDIGEKSSVRQPVEVTESYYKKNEAFLGMALATRIADGNETNRPIPNGYQYVGNQQYGRWRTNESG